MKDLGKERVCVCLNQLRMKAKEHDRKWSDTGLV